jgi:hypothetical protein
MAESNDAGSSNSIPPAQVGNNNGEDSKQVEDVPMQFIRHHDGKLEVVEETAKYLNSFNCPIVVIGIAGVIGSGKSYLINRYCIGLFKYFIY